ncbi:hypothetical protein GW7_18499 [Heterocephalus glaber]|uniref:Uncharacterized protein n=1 Tax=Heterocephalus glaber TaxID=10181 RepID=G5C4U3_HETGA|nr:hypothetical protein GW7_18499 [Heterocephalus glaber]
MSNKNRSENGESLCKYDPEENEDAVLTGWKRRLGSSAEVSASASAQRRGPGAGAVLKPAWKALFYNRPDRERAGSYHSAIITGRGLISEASQGQNAEAADYLRAPQLPHFPCRTRDDASRHFSSCPSSESSATLRHLPSYPLTWRKAHPPPADRSSHSFNHAGFTERLFGCKAREGAGAEVHWVFQGPSKTPESTGVQEVAAVIPGGEAGLEPARVPQPLPSLAPGRAGSAQQGQPRPRRRREIPREQCSRVRASRL